MSISSVTNFEISPLNQSSGTNGTFSYRNGNPIITLRLPSTQMYVLTSSLRLNYVLKVFQPSGVPPTNGPLTATGQVLISDRIGSNSVIDSVSVSTSTNSSIEQCRNYGRLLSSSIPASSGWNEYSTHLSQWFGGVCSSNLEVTAKCLNSELGVQCCSPLLTGVLGSGQNIPLGDTNGTGGLLITIQLNSNNQALFSSLPAMSGAYYELSDVTLTGKYGIPVGGALPPIQNIRFSAYQSYYDVINTNDHTGSIDCRLGAVSSVFSNFLPTTSIQNFGQDGFQTPGLANQVAGAYTNPAAVRTINFMRSGIKYPLQFQIDESGLRQVVQPAGGAGVGTRLSSYDALRQYYYQDSVRLTRNDIDALGGARSEGLLPWFNNVLNDSPSLAQVINYPSNPAMGRCFGIGVRYDQAGIGSSASFKSAPYSFRLTSDLDGISPTSIYTFFLYSTIMTLGFNGSVDVSS
tara:strand:- start:2241 stop:3626 length:1386 start_codon:yes stop_codon:yes gene_type:complete